MASKQFDRSVFAGPWLKFLDEFGESPALSGSLEDLSRQWDVLLGKLVAKYEIPGSDESVKTEQVNIEDFWVRMYTPPEATGKEPVGVYFHGGGWAMGSVDQEDAICRLISKQCKMQMVSVEYKLAPKHKYPVPLEDCVKSVKWTLRHYKAESVVIMGASAGGNLSFATALKLVDEGLGKSVKGVVAIVPVTVHPSAVPDNLKSKYTSYTENAINTVNTKSAMETFFDAYGAPADDKYTSCLLHPRLKDLPRCYITESGTDVLRDDARLMKEALQNAGVEVRYDDYPGFPHYSWTFPSKHLSEHSADFFGKLVQGIAWINEGKATKL